MTPKAALLYYFFQAFCQLFKLHFSWCQYLAFSVNSIGCKISLWNISSVPSTTIEVYDCQKKKKSKSFRKKIDVCQCLIWLSVTFYLCLHNFFNSEGIPTDGILIKKLLICRRTFFGFLFCLKGMFFCFFHFAIFKTNLLLQSAFEVSSEKKLHVCQT